MTVELNLVWIQFETIDLASMSLINYTDGFDLADNGWIPKVTTDDKANVIEVLTLRLKGTSNNDLSAIQQKLDLWKKRVGWSSDLIEKNAVWLRVKIDNETSQRQAMITKLDYALNASPYDLPMSRGNIIREVIVTIERTPLWEDPYPYITTTDKTGINCIGGTATLSETIRGDVPARLRRLDFIAGQSASYNKFWVGWRTSRFGTIANFVPVWSIHNGTGGVDTNPEADQSAYDGDRMTCTFGSDVTLIQRAFATVSDITANASDQKGSFIVLMRAKMSDTTIARARLRSGWYNGMTGTIDNPVIGSRQVISGTDWLLYEMGKVYIPPLKNFIVTVENFALGLDAEQVIGSGSGELHIDCFILIPVNDGMIRITSVSNIATVTTPDLLSIVSTPEMKIGGIKTTAAYGQAVSYDAADVSPVEWALPANDESPRLIGAGQSLGTNQKGDLFDMSYSFVERWRTLRGSEV